MSRIGELQLDIDKTAGNVVQLLVGKGKKIACAESCTGGLISAAITSVSGSSAVMDMSICTYAISAKERFIGVPAAIIDKYGVVSAETAAAMAEGVRKTAGSDIGISVTGIAGPTRAERGRKYAGTACFYRPHARKRRKRKRIYKKKHGAYRFAVGCRKYIIRARENTQARRLLWKAITNLKMIQAVCLLMR
jgi:PncC family amidohydrolase